MTQSSQEQGREQLGTHAPAEFTEQLTGDAGGELNGDLGGDLGGVLGGDLGGEGDFGQGPLAASRRNVVAAAGAAGLAAALTACGGSGKKGVRAWTCPAATRRVANAWVSRAVARAA